MLKTILLSLFISATVFSIEINEFNVLSKKKLELTKEYSQLHYGINSYKLKDPQIVVVHYTASDSLRGTLNYFKKDEIEGRRKRLKKNSTLNVGIHYVVDKDGAIYRLIPEDIMARHIIGLNYTSIGIENIGLNEKSLTPAQLKANVELVKYIKENNPSIKYLIGHHEYTDKSLPHYKLYRENVKSYRPSIKPDPGKKFMARLREGLRKKGITLMK